MPRMRANKILLKNWLQAPDWKIYLPEIAAMDAKQCVGPLLSFLLLGETMTARAAVALGVTVATMAEKSPETARNVLRRFMWHMNEESGNIGWGIPQAFAEVLVCSPRMAKEFHPILLSYIIDTGHDDNFCDHNILRRSCYWAVGRFGGARPELCQHISPWLIKGLEDADIPCRGVAAWALKQFPSTLEAFPALRRLAQAEPHILATTCTIFDGDNMQEYSISELVLTTPPSSTL